EKTKVCYLEELIKQKDETIRYQSLLVESLQEQIRYLKQGKTTEFNTASVARGIEYPTSNFSGYTSGVGMTRATRIQFYIMARPEKASTDPAQVDEMVGGVGTRGRR
ncbi:unnamed protein product, partial [Acanthoscelides obtectus]